METPPTRISEGLASSAEARTPDPPAQPPAKPTNWRNRPRTSKSQMAAAVATIDTLMGDGEGWTVDKLEKAWPARSHKPSTASINRILLRAATDGRMKRLGKGQGYQLKTARAGNLPANVEATQADPVVENIPEQPLFVAAVYGDRVEMPLSSLASLANLIGGGK